MERLAKRLETPKALVTTVTVLVTAFWLFAGGAWSWANTLWQHWTGSQVAHELRPEVAALKQLATDTSALAAQVAQRTDASEARQKNVETTLDEIRQLKKAETTLDEIRQIKEIEQERTQAVEQAQRSACLTGSLTADACDRLGYPRPVAK